MRALKSMIVPAVLAGSVATAAPIPIVNHSFEADFAVPNLFNITIPAGWELFDPAGIVDQALDAVGVLNCTEGTNFPGGPPDGSNVALIYLETDVGMGEVGLFQTLAATLTANTRYRLEVEVGDIASGFNAPPFDDVFFNLEGFPEYRVQILAGGVVVAEDDNSLDAVLDDGQFATSTLVLDVLPGHPRIGQNIGVRLINKNIAGTPEEPGIEVDFDRVRLDASPIPACCPGDADGDGEVDFGDAAQVLANFGAVYTPGTQNLGDANCDGTVSFGDIAELLANFGGTCR